METVTKKKRTCPFCGEVIEYKSVYEDGLDWMGHHRGHSKSYTVGDTKCKCEQLPFRMMCINCTFYDVGTCNNKNVVSNIKRSIKNLPFDIDINQDNIKDITSYCSEWELNDKLIGAYFKGI